MKAVVAAFNVITNLRMELFEALVNTAGEVIIVIIHNTHTAWLASYSVKIF